MSEMSAVISSTALPLRSRPAHAVMQVAAQPSATHRHSPACRAACRQLRGRACDRARAGHDAAAGSSRGTLRPCRGVVASVGRCSLFLSRARPQARILLLDNHEISAATPSATSSRSTAPPDRLRRQPVDRLAADAVERRRQGPAARPWRRCHALRRPRSTELYASLGSRRLFLPREPLRRDCWSRRPAHVRAMRQPRALQCAAAHGIRRRPADRGGKP